MIMKGFHVLGFFNQVGFIIAREIKGVPEGSKLAMPEDFSVGMGCRLSVPEAVTISHPKGYYRCRKKYPKMCSGSG
jgi:hypothetical protein